MTSDDAGRLVAIRSLDTPLAIVDREGLLVDASGGFADLVGRGLATLPGTALVDLVAPDGRRCLVDGLRSGAASDVRVAGRRGDGLPFLATLAIPGGGEEDRIVVARRRGPLVRAGGVLAARTGDADDGPAEDDGRDIVDAALSHDVRGALRGVSGFLSLLARSGEAWPDDVQGYLATARRSTATADAMVELLVEYVRIGQRTLTVDAVPLTDAVREAADAAGKAVGTSTEIDIADLPTVVGDRSHLVRLFAELLTNAGKFGASSVTVSAVVDELWTYVAVDDDGPGIDEHLRDRAFDLFRMLQPKGRHPGVGGGLAFVRRIAEVHGGRCTLEPSARGGARVVTRLLVA